MKTEQDMNSSVERGHPDEEMGLRRQKKTEKKDKSASSFFSALAFWRIAWRSDERKGRLNEEEAESLATSQLDNKGLM